MTVHLPLWPVTLPNGWVVAPMARGRRAEHVRKHLFATRERWWQITSRSQSELRRDSGQVKREAGDDFALDAYVRDYEPALRLTLADWPQGEWRMYLQADGQRVFVACHLDGPLVIARGSGHLVVRTAYREPPAAGGRTKRDFHEGHVRKVRQLASLASGPLGPEDDEP
jgi:hypothetical protein